MEAPNQHAWGLWSLTLGMDWLATLHSPQPCWWNGKSPRDAVATPHCEGRATETTPHAPARGTHPAGDWDTNSPYLAKLKRIDYT